MTVGEMLQRISSSELVEWRAYFDLEENPPPKVQTVAEARTVLEAMRKRSER